jgi:eukaryotic-like serine/threonine-protein kinase
MPPMALAQPGDVVDGRYQVLRALGAGAVAEVFEAFDQKRQREVALKIIRRSLAREPETLQRLDREYQVQEMIRHPNVARIYGGGVTANAEPYLVVELLRGRTLRHVLKAEGRVDVVRAASYTWQALQGLAAIHQAGVFHRDLKPANLMLEPSPGPVERVVLIDFGFAAMEGHTRLTAVGHVVGSLAYCAPERLQGQVGDSRADLYGMGIILYELLVGRRPFVADSEVDLITMQLDDPPLPPRMVAPDAGIPADLEAVVLRALAKTPGLRFASASEMAAAIETAMQAVR